MAMSGVWIVGRNHGRSLFCRCWTRWWWVDRWKAVVMRTVRLSRRVALAGFKGGEELMRLFQRKLVNGGVWVFQAAAWLAVSLKKVVYGWFRFRRKNFVVPSWWFPWVAFTWRGSGGSIVESENGEVWCMIVRLWRLFNGESHGVIVDFEGITVKHKKCCSCGFRWNASDSPETWIEGGNVGLYVVVVL